MLAHNVPRHVLADSLIGTLCASIWMGLRRLVQLEGLHGGLLQGHHVADSDQYLRLVPQAGLKEPDQLVEHDKVIVFS